MPRWSRVTYAWGLIALAVTYVALPDPPRLLWTVIGVASVVAIVAGVRGNRPRRRLPWFLVAAGTATFIAGDATYDVLTHVLGYANPFPSAADVLYLLTYPLFAVGLLLVVRARSAGSDRAALLDALIVTIGLGLLSWVFLVKPYVQDDTLTWVEKAVSVAYPLGDVLLLAVLARLLIGGGARSRSVLLLTVGTLGLLVADVLYGLTQLNGAWATGGPVDLGWIVFYGAWGAAALQPDMVDLAEPVRTRTAVLTRPRLALLAVASLIPSGLLLVRTPLAELLDVGVIAVTSAALFLLVTLRLDGLIGVARRSAQRERALRRAGEALVATSSREEVYRASAQAVLEFTDHADDHRVVLAIHGGSGLSVAYDTGRGFAGSGISGLAVFLARHDDRLREHHFLLTDSNHVGEDLHTVFGPGVPVLVGALVRDGVVAGVLMVTGSQVRRAGMIDAVCALAAQTMLALESTTLTEQVLQQRSEVHFRSLIQNASDVILVLDADLRVAYQTPSVQAVLGYLAEEIQNRPVTTLLAGEDAQHASVLLRRAVAAASTEQSPQHSAEPTAEWQLRHAGGRLLQVEVTCRNLLNDPSVNGLVLTLHDVTERRALEEDLKHLAFHDSLTGLPNRALFLDRVEHALRRQGRHRERLAVMLIDLDDFKMVNDTRGHAAGDALLVAMAQRLRDCLRPEDTGARLGGDEFAVLVEGLMDDDEARQLAQRVLQALGRPFHIGTEDLVVRASVGVATSDYGSEAADLLRQADLAMYAAKENGKGTHEFFRSSLQDQMAARAQLRTDLERGLQRSEFVLHYQPVLNLATGQMTGAEALVRWQHPERGLILPGEFIDTVEQTDLAVPLGGWVLDQAIAQAARWRQAHPNRALLNLSVNVAPRQLRDPGFVDTVATALARHGVPARTLSLEITERLLAGEDPQIVQAMSALRDLGVSLSLDDFGTGYSALAYLRRFPVTALKIDRSFIAGLDRSPDDHALVEAIVRLGQTFGLDLVAEGIETEAQRDALIGLGCRRGQGFLYSRPIPAPDLNDLLKAEHTRGLHHEPAALAAP